MKAPKKYLNSRKVTIDFLLEKPKRTYTIGTFHKLRVELKKLNAFLDLTNYCAKDFKRTKTYKPFRQIFRQAGKVREVQLQEAMLKIFFPDNSIPEYKALLRKTRLEEKRVFGSMINSRMITRFRGKFDEIDSFLPDIKPKNAARYLDKEIDSIQNLLNQNPLQKEKLHQLRKRLKTLNYNRSSLSLKGYSNQIKKKDSLPKLLGKWHDLQVMLKHLDDELVRGRINSEEVIQLGNLKTQIFLDSEILFTQIQKALPVSDFFDLTT